MSHSQGKSSTTFCPICRGVGLEGNGVCPACKGQGHIIEQGVSQSAREAILRARALRDAARRVNEDSRALQNKIWASLERRSASSYNAAIPVNPPLPELATEEIVERAVALMRSDYASLQMLFPERGSGGELLLLGFQGFNPQAAKFWKWVRADSKSTCGLALRDARRVVAADIPRCEFMADSEDQQVYVQAGILACQTTPLISRAGNVVGMISTHWRTPHQPSKDDLREFDLLARDAAERIERCRCQLPSIAR